MADRFTFVLDYERLSKLGIVLLYAMESDEFEQTLTQAQYEAYERLLAAVDKAKSGILTSGRIHLTAKEKRGLDGVETLVEADIQAIDNDDDHPWTRDELESGLGALRRFRVAGWVHDE